MSRCRSDRAGFSLIELVVVLLLMAVLAAIASIQLQGVVIRGRLVRAAEVIEQFDTALRRQARNERRPVQGVIDRGRQRLTVDPSGNQSKSYALPKQVKIDAVLFGLPKSSNSRNQIVAGRDGESRSYAVRLTTQQAERWVFFSGGSGQVIHNLNRKSIQSLLSMK